MPKIEVSKTINADRKKAFDIIKAMERFPEFMRDVKNVKILERANGRIITQRKTDIDGVPIEWTEEDTFNNKDFCCRFKSIKGEYKYDGIWKVADDGKDRVKVLISVNFDWEIPELEKFIGPTLEKKARISLRSMLNAIKKKAENE